jgi:hypothetical protein
MNLIRQSLMQPGFCRPPTKNQSLRLWRREMSLEQYDVNLRYGVDTSLSLAGKVAVVTGGFGGIAMASNRMMLEKGATLALLYPPFEHAVKEKVVQEFGEKRVHYFECDVSDPAQVSAVFKQIEERCGHIDLLVNCAGYVQLEPG